jgi:hypothetical protein
MIFRWHQQGICNLFAGIVIRAGPGNDLPALIRSRRAVQADQFARQ